MSSLSCRLTGNDWMKVFTSLLLSAPANVLRDTPRDTWAAGDCPVWRPAGKSIPAGTRPLHPVQCIIWGAGLPGSGIESGSTCRSTEVAQRRCWGRSKRNRIESTAARRIGYDFSALVGQMRYKLCQPAPTRKCQYSTSVSASIASNKRLRKPDCDTLKLHSQLVPGEITRWAVASSGQHAVCKHMTFQNTIMSAILVVGH